MSEDGPPYVNNFKYEIRMSNVQQYFNLVYVYVCRYISIDNMYRAHNGTPTASPADVLNNYILICLNYV